jgi:DNA-binding Lrp family transcriptional regulator
MNAIPARPVLGTPTLDDIDQRLVEAIQDGLPVAARPYALVAERLGIGEGVVIGRIANLLNMGLIKRLGVVVRHRELGYGANAMVVWNIPDAAVDTVATRLAHFECITLCYRRPRRLPDWPYNLFCMIHGHKRESVTAHLDWLVDELGLHRFPREVLFSRRRFKQRGARFAGLTPRGR